LAGAKRCPGEGVAVPPKPSVATVSVACLRRWAP
jgi:hypothetical protein